MRVSLWNSLFTFYDSYVCGHMYLGMHVEVSGQLCGGPFAFM